MGGSSRRSSSQSLPFSKSKPKTHKRRRHQQLRDLLFTNLFSIFIFFSFIFLLFIILNYGIPKPGSSKFFNSSKSNAVSRPKRSLQRKPISQNSLFSSVDITTKSLYDKIDFLDLDGGAWKQGWEVKYKGDEWDDEKLKVFVVPHSHNDPGWKLTVEEYYQRQSRHILDTIVETLSKDARRKFIWEEMSYLQRWWRDAKGSKREDFVNLVKNGQLEIVGGGWVMNDEANSHYYAIIEQMMEGNTWLSDTVGVVPKNAWAIDPFGYSATMAYLLRRMGFENMLIQRTHYELKKELALHQNLEFLWRQSWDIEQTTDIFVHMMPFYSYDVPHTCGPEPAICCQFDFARMPGHGYEACPWRLYPVETNPDNVEERAKKLLDQYRKKSTLYRTNTLLVPLGDDFRYVSVNEAEAQFRNYQMLFDYINANPSLNAEVKFGTLEDYFQTLRAESERRNFSRPGEMGSRELGGFPTLSGDFFTYADRQKDYWSGYYVSRPFFKAVDRVLEETLRAAEIMMALVLGYCPRASCMKLPVGFALKLTAARRSLALFQHHDGVTGTAKDHVVEDYGLRMHTSLDDLQVFMAKSVDALLNVPQYKIEQPSSVAEYEAEQVRSKFDIQPVHRIIDVPEGSYQSVVFFNPLEQTREEVVMLVVKRPDFCVLSSNWSSVNSQVVPELQYNDDNLFTGMHRLFFKVSVPPLGLQTYHVANGYVGCQKPKLSKLRVTTKKDSMHCPAPYMCAKLTDDTVHIRNHLHTLSFNAKRGLLTKVTRHKDAIQTDVQEEINMYSSVGGAYLFKPTGNAEPIIESGGRLIISEGPLVQEVFSYPKTSRQQSPISHTTRIYNEENTVQEFLIQKEYHVRMVQHDYDDKELITRFKTNIENNRIFYSDLNGFQMIRRETYDKIPVQGNYYPMPSQAFLQDSVGHRFSVHTRQSLGVASLKTGWLEIMLDRRLTRDDERGLGQGVLDNRPMNVLFHLLLETNVSSSDSLPLNPSLLSHLVSDHLNYPMHAFIHKKQEEISSQSPSKSFSPLSASLPCDIHIVNFKAPRPLTASQITPGEPRFVLILQRRGWDTSYCKKGGIDCSTSTDGLFDIFTMFKDLSVLSVRPTSLNILHDDIEQIGNIDEPVRKQLREVEDDKYVMLHPMELQAFKLEVKPNQ